MRRLFGILLACVLALGCSVLPASAAEAPDGPPAIARVSAQMNQVIPSKTMLYLDEFTLVAGDTIQYDCTYTPKSASVDFGYIAPDGKFHCLNRTNGSISKTFQVASAGTYTLAICNNSSYTVTVTGTVRY